MRQITGKVADVLLEGTIVTEFHLLNEKDSKEIISPRL